MFKLINKIDTSAKDTQKNAIGLALISLAIIVSVSQEPNHYSNKLFDENQQLVSQDLDSPWFKVSTNEGLTFVVDEKQYNELKKDLSNLTEITKVNDRDEEGKALIDLTQVKAIVEQVHVQERDENGNLKVDDNGNPIYKPTKYAILRKDGQPFYIYEKECQRLIKLLTK